MHLLASYLVAAVVLLSFWVLASSRLLTCLRAIAFQGAALSVLPLLLLGGEAGSRPEVLHALALAAASLAIKAWLMPWQLWRAIRTTSIRREVEPLLGHGASLLIAAGLTMASFVAVGRLPLSSAGALRILPAGGIATLLMGMLVLVARTKAVTQVVGYIMVENGIFLFGLLLSRRMPYLVEAGILLDVFAGVFIMGIFIYRIQQTFDHMDTHHLAALRD